MSNITKTKNLKELIENSFKRYPKNIAYLEKDINKKYKPKTYTDLYNDINLIGNGLLDLLGNLNNKKIALIGENSYDWITIYLAVVNGNGIIVPIDKELKEDEIKNILTVSDVDAIVYSKTKKQIVNKIKTKNNFNFINISMKTEDKDEMSLNTIKERGINNNGYNDIKIDNEKLSVLLFTSGTSADPKAVMLSHKNIVFCISNVCDKSIKIYENDKAFSVLPLHHTYEATVQLFLLSKGASIGFLENKKTQSKDIQDIKPTVWSVVPAYLEFIKKKLNKEIKENNKDKLITKLIKVTNIFPYPFSIYIKRKIFKNIINSFGGNLRLIISGASKLDPKTAQTFNDFGIIVRQGYGMTEASPVMCAEEKKWNKLGSVGFTYDKNVEIDIINKDKDEIGEIIYTGDNVMLGYYNNEEATKEVLKCKDGKIWLHTGDLGKLEKGYILSKQFPFIKNKNYLFITGRTKNIIKTSNGKLIYPEEIEEELYKNDIIEEVIIDIIDNKVTAIIYLNKTYIEKHNIIDINIFLDKIIDLLNQKLPNFKKIRKIIISNEELEKTTTMKIKRQQVLEKIKKIGDNK